MEQYQCRECKNTIHISTAKYGSGLCKHCGFLGKRNPNYGNKKLLGKNNPMFNKKRPEMSGSNSIFYKDGITLKENRCLDCSKILKSYRAKRCPKCANSGKHNANYGKKRPEHSKLMSGKNNPRFGKAPPQIKGFYYKKRYMRSSYEINFAIFLDGSNIKWEYESASFDLGDTTYTPDFYLPEFDCYIETKGWFREEAKIKFNKFLKEYNNVNIKLFNQESLKLMGIIRN